MKTGAEIKAVLDAMKPIDRPDGFATDPLCLASGSIGNPASEDASVELGWPLPICEAVSDAFHVEEKSATDDGWPVRGEERKKYYRRRFTLAIRAGTKACMEHDEPGSQW